APRESLLPPLVPGTDHPAERELRTPVTVDEARTDNGDVRFGGESNEQTVDCSRRHNRVAVQQQDRRASARTNADVVRGGESEVLGVFDNTRGGIAAGAVRTAIAGMVVHNDDLVRRLRRGR